MMEKISEAKEFIEGLKSIDAKISEKLGRDRALLYTIILLQNTKIEALYPEISVSACKLFPLFFSLKGEFSEYPDGRKVRDCLWHLVDEKKAWVKGNTKSGYIPTEIGKDIYEKEIATLLKGKTQVEFKKYSTGSDKQEYFIRRCFETDAFLKFYKGEQEDIKEYEIRYLLRGTRTTDRRILRDNLHKYLKYYKNLSFEDVKIDPKTKKTVLSKKEWQALGELLNYLEKNFDKIILKK